MDRLPRSVHVATALLIVNMTLGLWGGPLWLVASLVLAGPAAVLWMVWQVLNDRTAVLRDLPEGSEWGYQDRQDLRPVQEEA